MPVHVAEISKYFVTEAANQFSVFMIVLHVSDHVASVTKAFVTERAHKNLFIVLTSYVVIFW